MPLFMTSMQHMMGMPGEKITDERCWIIKTHHPMGIPGSVDYSSHKIICIVRNPIDTFPSMMNLANSASHSASMPFEYHEEDPDWWNEMVKMFSKRHATYYDLLHQDCVEKKLNPVYYMRYEDLLKDKRKELEQIFKFILELDDIEGTNVQRRII